MVQINPLVQPNYQPTRPYQSNRSNRLDFNENQPNKRQADVLPSNSHEISADQVSTKTVFRLNEVTGRASARGTSSQSPITQYQINDQLLQRDQLTSLLGVDFYA